MELRRLNQKGFTIVVAVSVLAAVVITFFSVIQFFNFVRRQSAVLFERNTALIVAEAGSNKTLGAIGLCPDLAELDRRYPGFPSDPAGDGLSNIDGFFDVMRGDITDASGKRLGHFVSMAQLRSDFSSVLQKSPIYYIVTTGWPEPKKGLENLQVGETVHTYAYISDTGKYSIAASNSLKIGDPDSSVQPDLSGMLVYGRNLTLDYNTQFTASDTPIKIGAAFYKDFCDPPPEEWASRNPDGAILIQGERNIIPCDPLPFNGTNLITPEIVADDVVFPDVEESYDLPYYSFLARKAGANSCFNGMSCYTENDMIVRNGDVYPPTWNGTTVTNPTLHVYYSCGTITLGGVIVHGNVLFVAQRGFIIDGDIMSKSFDTVYTCGECYRPLGHPSCAPGVMDPEFVKMGWNPATVVGRQASRSHLAVLITPLGMNIGDYKPGSLAQDRDGDVNKLTVHAYLFCPRGHITANPGLAATRDDNKFLFQGAMLLRDTPAVGAYFKERSYKKNWSIHNSQTAPPGIPQLAIVRARFYSPHVPEEIPTPDPTFFPSWSPFPSPT